MVDAQQVVEDLGVAPVVVLHLPQLTGLAVHDRLDAAGDADEGALGGVTPGLLVVDDFEDLVDLLAQRLGQMPVGGVRVDDVAHDLLGRIAHPQPPDGGGHDFLGEPHGLGVMAEDAVFQVGDALFVLRALGGHGPLAAVQRHGEYGDHERGDRTAHGDWYPRGRDHQGRPGDGGRGQQDHGGQDYADDGDFSVGRR